MTRLLGDTNDDAFGTIDGGVGTITLNRPARRNAMSPEMLVRLGDLLHLMDASDDVGCVVLTGSGNAFCSGGDVLDFNERGGEGSGASEVDSSQVAEQVASQRATVGKIYAMDTPVIASLPGAAAGAGLGLALAADLRIGSPRALLVTAFASVGLSGDYGVAWFLHHLVGPAKARELLYLSPRLDASASLELGLLNWVTEPDGLTEQTRDVATSLANGPRTALAHMKRNLAEAPRSTLFDAMDAEVPRHKACGLTQDHLRAIAAFADKQGRGSGGR
ncbi:2-(1,2-epoxy-1,2-dihydrophenyl)acetyl-CoA isomerase [Tamaricihabitans halophyticus]|uniref:2-(1,2-epoxy-1,2-dihydrophenyl)acetyl-CoA isomerase n=1 Tax=Tamaricihabitans halophyticus TaxID=1262583 RepID=A0A4R2QQL6_9PSEU|nr:enoyl-CoA hydratase-related protein [Tamaricihabitans halophyticus]TCP51897.1 2-(1,2-epoxy-1,2-dihydrophenyl)acetyl-CoA isomerase [Tamaricihabitans halophyticus]